MAEEFLRANRADTEVCDSVVGRRPANFCRPGLVVAGFPCQPFSAGRGALIKHTIALVEHRLPDAVLLENVAAFCRAGNGSLLRWVIAKLEMGGKYHVEHRILCSSRFGLPQTRRRWFLIALRVDAIVRPFLWPSERSMVPLDSILGPPPSDASHHRRPGLPGSLSCSNVDREVARLEAEGIDPSSVSRIIDCDDSRSWCGKSKLLAPCLTRSRSAGLWNIAWGERLGPAACVRLQGFAAGAIAWPTGDRLTRALAGNGMSLCVVEPILRNMAVAVGFDEGAMPHRLGVHWQIWCWTPGEAYRHTAFFHLCQPMLQPFLLASGVFNQPIGHWDMGSVTTMENSFRLAVNQPSSNSGTSIVTTMSHICRSMYHFCRPARHGGQHG